MGVVPILPFNTPILPSLESQPFAHLSSYQNAYKLILAAERHAIDFLNGCAADRCIQGNILSARIVGFFLIEFYTKSFVLSEAPCLEIIHQVELATKLGKDTSHVIYRLGALYRDLLDATFRTSLCEFQSRVTRCSYPDRPKSVEELIKDAVNADFKIAKKRALARDGYRCVVIRALDMDVCCENEELSDMFGKKYGIWPADVRHIVKESAVEAVEPGSDEKPFSSTFARLLEQFRLEDIVTVPTQDGNIHDLRNLVTLSLDLYSAFGLLYFWFEPTNKPNQYTSHVVHRGIKSKYWHFEEKPLFTVFPSHHKDLFPLPDCNLLTLHGVCARVAYVSGATKYFDDLDKGAEH